MGKGMAVTAITVMIVALAGCGGGSGGGAVGVVNPSGNPPIVAAFNPSGSVAGPEVVQLGGTAAGNQVNLSVDVGSPVSADVRSFSFDLLIGDPSVVSYVAGSATVGSGWTDPGNVTVQVSQQGDRIIIGVARLGGGAGFPGGEVVDLMLELGTAGASTVGFAPSPAPVALDGSAQPVTSVQFDATSATVQGS